MDNVMHIAWSLQFASPLFALAVAPAVLIILASFILCKKRSRNSSFAMADFQDLMNIRLRTFLWPHKLRSALAMFALMLCALILASPSVQTISSLSNVERPEVLRHLVVVLDISGSMQGTIEAVPLGTDAETLEKMRRFNVMRDLLTEFLQSQNDLRVSVVFFSTKPFLYRWFTTDIPELVEDLRELSLSDQSPYVPQGSNTLGFSSQFHELSGATDGAAAIQLVREHIAKNLPESLDIAVLFMSDMEDDFGKLTAAIQSLLDDGLRFYGLTIAPFSSIDLTQFNPLVQTPFGLPQAADSARARLQELHNRFASYDSARFFNILSAEDVREAYSAIAEIESGRFIRRSIEVRQSALLPLVILLCGTLMLLVGLTYTIARRFRP